MGVGTTSVAELASASAGTVGARLAEQSRAHGPKILLHTPLHSLTYREFDERVNRRARILTDLGVAKGDTVSQMLGNSSEFLVNWIALAKLGAVQVGLNTEFQGAALARLINSVESRILIVGEEYEAAIANIASELRFVDCVVSPEPVGHVFDARLGQFETVALDGLEPNTIELPTPDISLADPLMLIFTSGTTGPSKAIEISHNYALHFAAELIEHYELVESDTMYSAYPLFHAEASILTFLVALHRGATAVIMPKFSVSRFWDDIRTYGVTYTTLMGAVMTFLWKQPTRLDDADNPLRLVTSAPTPLFWRDFEKRFNVKCVETYGSTEGSQVAWDSLVDEHRAAACGKICSHYEVQIVDELDRVLPTGELGEIVTRPRAPFTMMTGYYKNAEATAQAFRNLWYHTGDFGYFDQDGYLYFAGRKKDGIRRRGKNISAYEVEEVLDRHPDVLESAVIGVPSEFTEDDVKAVITLREGKSPDPEQLLSWAATSMPAYAVPRYVEFARELPKSVTGKVQKAQLRESWRNSQTYDREAKSTVSLTD